MLVQWFTFAYTSKLVLRIPHIHPKGKSTLTIYEIWFNKLEPTEKQRNILTHNVYALNLISFRWSFAVWVLHCASCICVQWFMFMKDWMSVLKIENNFFGCILLKMYFLQSICTCTFDVPPTQYSYSSFVCFFNLHHIMCYSNFFLSQID